MNGIYVAQIRALYQHIPIVLLVNIVNSALVAIVLASYKGQTWWLVFLALTIALTGANALGWVRYRRTSGWAQSASRMGGSGNRRIGAVRIAVGRRQRTFASGQPGGADFRCFCHRRDVRRLSCRVFQLSAGLYCLCLPRFATTGGPLLPRRLDCARRHDGGVRSDNNPCGMQFYSRLCAWIAFELRSDREDHGAGFGKSTTALGDGAAEGRGGPAAASPQNGGRRSIDRRHRSRFQQPAHSSRRAPRNGARPR